MDGRLRRTFELCQNRTLQLCRYTLCVHNLSYVKFNEYQSSRQEQSKQSKDAKLCLIAT